MTNGPLRDTWLMFQRANECSVDRMLCRPELRSDFLNAARQATPLTDEEAILWAVVNLRKKKALPAVLK